MGVCGKLHTHQEHRIYIISILSILMHVHLLNIYYTLNAHQHTVQPTLQLLANYLHTSV